MEIKGNVGGAIELQLPMRSTVVVGDAVTLIKGYDGTREAAKLLGEVVVENMKAEMDIPGVKGIVS